LNPFDADPWSAYFDLPPRSAPADRERALADLLDSPLSPELERAILTELSLDPLHQSRQARFIRRYGFYADWFNRIFYSLSRAVQGNVQAVAQLPVDAAFQMFGSGEATPAERRAYRLLRELQSVSRDTPADARERERLAAKVDRALAEVDADRARAALERGDPDLAEYYARASLQRDPDRSDAEKVLDRAAIERARRLRAADATRQVGIYTTPPLDGDSTSERPILIETSPEPLRAMLAGRYADLADAATANGASPESPTFDAALALDAHRDDPVAVMHEWVATLDRLDAPIRGQTSWILRAAFDPQFNPDLRLARAQASRRGGVARYVFLGPDDRRERAYRFSSRVATAWTALERVGLLYGFEVVFRAVGAAFRPPHPSDEVLDSAISYLRAAPEREDASRLAEWLADRYVQSARYDDARDLLGRFDLLDERRAEAIDRREARRWLVMAEDLPRDDPRRPVALARAIELAPDTRIARNAEKAASRTERPAAPQRADVAWSAAREWLAAPLPAGLPGRAEWFDGDPANGEVEGGAFALLTAADALDSATIEYVVRLPEGRRAVRAELNLSEQPAPTAAWLRFAASESVRRARALEGLGRPGIPYEISGGVGVGGVDLHPKLLPIETRPGELDFYRDPPP
jgi:hypothetical protein